MSSSKSSLKDRIENNLPLILLITGLIFLFIVMAIWYVGGQQQEFIVLAIFLLFITILIIFNGLLLMIQSLRNRIEKLEFMMRLKFPEANSNTNGINIPTVKSVVLNNLERRIINVLKEQKTEVTQTELKDLCQLNKTTLSLYLSSLEEKGLIRKLPKGRTNIVTLIKEVKT
ncbi:MAG: helix-turn-helix transcriptional regulator [Candidatus Helarchaeota archaeon]